MEKFSRIKSPDPKQEALREHKAQWNGAASKFIAKLIAFKKSMNGRGDPKLGLPPSNIKEPLPEAVGAFLKTLAQEFDMLVHSADGIVTQQAEYAANRRKPITREASNPLSRSLFLIKNFLSGQPNKHFKSSIIKMSVSFLDSVIDFEKYLLGFTDSSIEGALHNWQTVKYSYNSLLELLESFSKVNLRNAPKEKTEEESETLLLPKTQTKSKNKKVMPAEVKKMVKLLKDKEMDIALKLKDVESFLKAWSGDSFEKSVEVARHLERKCKQFLQKLSSLSEDVIKYPNPENRIEILAAIYDEVFSRYSKELEKLSLYSNTKLESFMDYLVWKQGLSTQASVVSDMKSAVLSLNFLSDIAPLKKETYEITKRLKSNIRKFMDFIENGGDGEAIISSFMEVQSTMAQLSELMDVLYSRYKEIHFKSIEDKRLKDKSNKYLDYSIFKDFPRFNSPVNKIKQINENDKN